MFAVLEFGVGFYDVACGKYMQSEKGEKYDEVVGLALGKWEGWGCGVFTLSNSREKNGNEVASVGSILESIRCRTHFTHLRSPKLARNAVM